MSEPWELPLLDVPGERWSMTWDRLMRDPWLRKKLDRERRLQEHWEYLSEHVGDKSWDLTAHHLVIDIGPGTGETLELARHRQYSILGIDANTGTGGMGTNYLLACRLMAERQQLPIYYVGWESFVETVLSMPEAFRTDCVLFNFRGSIEQAYARHMDGPAHDKHHKVDNLSWRLDDVNAIAFRKFFQVACHFLKSGGVLLIHANGAANGDEADRLLGEISKDYPLEHVVNEPRIHKWVKQ